MKVAWSIVVIALLAGCGGASIAPSGVGAVSQIGPAATGGDLLYVSDTDTSRVYVFTYPGGKLEQTLSDFRDPGGECADANGDVFITNTGDENVIEYAHGATKPSATLSDSNWFPIGCAVDPKTGNLAVTNFSSGSSGPGDVAIYAHAKGKAKHQYSDAAITGMLLCGYDASGNLFVDGFPTGSSGFAFAELPTGKSKFVNVTLNQSIQTPGGVQWDGKYVAVGDQSADAIYRFAVSGTKGTKAGTTPLNGGSAVFQFWIDGTRVIGPDSSSGDVKLWKYPAGGTAVKTIDGLYAPLGTAVSKGQTQ
jgi:hypothetical protein